MVPTWSEAELHILSMVSSLANSTFHITERQRKVRDSLGVNAVKSVLNTD